MTALAGGTGICAFAQEAKSAGDDALNFFPCFGMRCQRLVIHALLDLKAFRFLIRLAGNRFVNVSRHSCHRQFKNQPQFFKIPFRAFLPAQELYPSG